MKCRYCWDGRKRKNKKISMINTSIIWSHLCKFVSFCEIEKEYKNACTDVTVTKMVKKYEGKFNNTRKEK